MTFTPLGASARVSMKAASASKMPPRKPASCVPPERVGIKLTWLSAKTSPSATQPIAQEAPSPGSISAMSLCWKYFSPLNIGATSSRPWSMNSKYCAIPRSYFQVLRSLPSTSRTMVRPGRRYAFERTRCSSSASGMCAESKYFGSGHKRTMVPVRFSLMRSDLSFCLSSPPSNAIVCFCPSRNTVTSQRFESAFDTATPTPCRPPEM